MTNGLSKKLILDVVAALYEDAKETALHGEDREIAGMAMYHAAGFQTVRTLVETYDAVVNVSLLDWALDVMTQMEEPTTIGRYKIAAYATVQRLLTALQHED